MNTVLKLKDKISHNYSGFAMAGYPDILREQISADGTIKILLGYSDGKRVESVIMPFFKRYTVCLSCQSGCAMGCTFCRTGMHGFKANLTDYEIVAQYLVCYQRIIDLKQIPHIPKPGIVFMGEGEPLHNFDNVKSAIEIFLDKTGICTGPRLITLSTVGYLPGLKRISEFPCVNFAISIHSAIPDKRKLLIPLENTNSIESLTPYIRQIKLRKNQFINFEYLLIKNFNDTEEDAAALEKYILQFRSIVNIIPYNRTDQADWQYPDENEVRHFKEMLAKRGIRTMIRTSKGQDIDAGCGQLKGYESED